MRENPTIFLGSKDGEDHQEFIDGLYKVFSSMGVTSREKGVLASYKLKDVALLWYTQWNDDRPVESDPIEWHNLRKPF